MRPISAPDWRATDGLVTWRFRVVHASAPHLPEFAERRREDRIVFVIRLQNGEEFHGAGDDELTINEHTGVVSVTRIDGFEEVTTHFSPVAWASVTHRVKEPVVRRPNTRYQ